MPIIFKNIRRKLAAQNKAMAYLRYAIGEIFLVVIGILIALQVNNWNENRKEQSSIKRIFLNIQQDLLSNIYEFSLADDWLVKQDSMSTKVIEGRYTRADYRNPANAALFLVGSTGYEVSARDRSFRDLNNFKGELPATYDDLVAGLNSLYVGDNTYLQMAGNRLVKTSLAYRTYLHQHYAWVVDLAIHGTSEKAIDYFLNSSRHKQQVVLYRHQIRTQYAYTSRMYHKAIINYLKIEYYFGNYKHIPDQIKQYGLITFDRDNDYPGTYSYTNKKGKVGRFEIKYECNLLLWKGLGRNNFYIPESLLKEKKKDELVFPFDKNILFKMNRDKDGTIIGFTSYINGKKDAVFRKIINTE
jgi:hypothetical protein